MSVNHYKSIQSMSWTRADMLLLIYDRALQAISGGIQALQSGDTAPLARHRLDAHKALLMLADGLDLSQGEVPQNVLRLAVFAIDQTSGTETDAWIAARGVLQTLRDAFAQVRDDVNQLEASGRIPALVS